MKAKMVSKKDNPMPSQWTIQKCQSWLDGWTRTQFLTGLTSPFYVPKFDTDGHCHKGRGAEEEQRAKASN
jgi:hypothetical protein